MDFKTMINDTIAEMHEKDTTCQILYDSIERCSDDTFSYFRDIANDSFFDNENMIEQRDGKYYYAYTEHLFGKDINVTKFDDLLKDLIQSEEEDKGQEYIDWIKISYREYLAHYFKICLIRLNKDNETLFDDVLIFN